MSTILIGVDPTARSEDAIALGRRFARPGAGRVIVASVTPADRPRRDEAHATVRRMSGLLAGVAPERIRTAVVAGRTPAQALYELAGTERASVLVVGSTHRVRLGRTQPGGTGERLLRGAPCAVALAPHGYRSQAEQPISRVGVAFDGSTESRAAFAAALSAAQAGGAVLEVITVMGTPFDGPGVVAAAPGLSFVLADANAELRRQQQDAMTDLPGGVRAEPVELEGEPAAALAEHSAGLDLLFVGSRGYGPLRAVVEGGTSGALLRLADCPVIVLPRGLEAPLAEVFEPAVGAAR